RGLLSCSRGTHRLTVAPLVSHAARELNCAWRRHRRAPFPSTAVSAGTRGAAILAAFCRKASPSGAGCLGLTGLLYFCHPRPVNGYLPFAGARHGISDSAPRPRSRNELLSVRDSLSGSRN